MIEDMKLKWRELGEDYRTLRRELAKIRLADGRYSMPPGEAAQTLDAEIKRLAAERGLSYPEAFKALQREEPKLVTGYQQKARKTK